MSTETAQLLSSRLGPAALDAVKVCVEECRRLRDTRGHRFWNKVLARLESTTNGDASPSEVSGAQANGSHRARRQWELMQRSQIYRHRAMKAEREAGGSEAHQEVMIDIAVQWLELAEQYERLADSAEA
jgi:hypothetical protein